MKILLANSRFGGGGITAFAEELIKCLSEDHELTVVLPDDSLRPIKNPKVKVLHYDTKKLTKENALFFIKLINEELRPDLVISSLGIIIPIIAPYLNDNIRVVTVSHSGRYFNSEYSAFNHKYVDNIIAASSDYNKHYLERKFHIQDKNKVRVIYNFMASNPELEQCHEAKKENNPISIVYAGGGRSPAKNPDFVLKVLCELLKTDLNFKFYWTGNTMLPLMHLNVFRKINPHDIRQFIKKDERVVFTGKIPSKEEFDHLIASSNILLSPSRNEGCSMLVLEALRSGSILMVGDYPHGNREIVERGNCGFIVNHKKPHDACKQLMDIIVHHDNYIKYYNQVYETYKRMFTYEVWKASLEKLLEEKPRHKHRKASISEYRLSHDIRRMKRLKKTSVIKRFFEITIRSLNAFFLQYIKMRIKGEYPGTNI